MTWQSTSTSEGFVMHNCICCNCRTSQICVKGACLGCHREGLCHE